MPATKFEQSDSEEIVERLWRAEQVADRLQISRTRVYELLRSGDLRSVRIGGSRRISEKALREFLSSLSQ